MTSEPSPTDDRTNGRRYTYTGDPVPSLVPTTAYEGYTDALRVSTRNERHLYRYPKRKHVAWTVGNLAGRLIRALWMRPPTG